MLQLNAKMFPIEKKNWVRSEEPGCQNRSQERAPARAHFPLFGVTTQPDSLYVPEVMHKSASLLSQVPLLIIKDPPSPFYCFRSPS